MPGFLHLSPLENGALGNSSPSLIKNMENETDTRGLMCKVIKFMSYLICLSFFFANSFAIFQNFASDIKIRSTKVVPSPGGVLDSPTVLLCNSSAYKKAIIPTTLEDYKNQTMTLDDFLVDAFMIKHEKEGFLSYQPISIKHNFKEIATMFRGTCIMLDKRFKVI